MIGRWISFWGPAYFQGRTVRCGECANLNQGVICAMVKAVAFVWGWETDGKPPTFNDGILIMGPYKPLLLGWWVYPQLYGNNGSLDPGTYEVQVNLSPRYDTKKTQGQPLVLRCVRAFVSLVSGSTVVVRMGQRATCRKNWGLPLMVAVFALWLVGGHADFEFGLWNQRWWHNPIASW